MSADDNKKYEKLPSRQRVNERQMMQLLQSVPGYYSGADLGFLGGGGSDV